MTDFFLAKNDLASALSSAHGGKSILQSRKSGDEKIELPKGADTGTAQFWKLFEACSGIGPGQDGMYGSKVLKKNEPNEETRIGNKLHILLRT